MNLLHYLGCILLTVTVLSIAGVAFYFDSAVVAGLYESIKEWRDNNGQI
mgnify:CR=1 FL=1|jgi:hypothetical protein